MSSAILLTKNFQDVVNTAVSAASSNQWRRCADNYKYAFELKPNNENISPYKYHTLCGFSNVLIEGQIPLKKEDYKFLKNIAEDQKGEFGTLLRAKACFTIGFCLWSSYNKINAIAAYQQAIVIGSEAADEENSIVMMYRDPVRKAFLPAKVGVLLQSVVDASQNNLEVLEGNVPVSDQMSSVIGQAKLCNRESAQLQIHEISS